LSKYANRYIVVMLVMVETILKSTVRVANGDAKQEPKNAVSKLTINIRGPKAVPKSLLK